MMGIGQAVGQIYSAIYFSAPVSKMRNGIQRLKYLIPDMKNSENEYKNLNQRRIKKAEKVENRIKYHGKTQQQRLSQQTDTAVKASRPLPPIPKDNAKKARTHSEHRPSGGGGNIS